VRGVPDRDGPVAAERSATKGDFEGSWQEIRGNFRGIDDRKAGEVPRSEVFERKTSL
jgi:hypothetical protein